MHQQYADKGLVVLAVNLDSDTAMAKQFLQHIPAQFPIVFNPTGSIAELYDLLGMPSSFLIDRSGTIRYSHQGFFVDKQSGYEHELLTLLNKTE